MNPTTSSDQRLPAAGPAREVLRHKGQFWTPAWLADAMVAWTVGERPASLFDPAVGPGTFFAAARRAGFHGLLLGYELYPESFLNGDCASGLNDADFGGVCIEDFISARDVRKLPAIVSNPPYIRHHRLSEARKATLREMALRLLGFAPDGRTGLQLFFLLKCLAHLAPNGRLAFLLPADVCEGVSAPAIWQRLTDRFRLDAVVTFDPAAAPFPRVDTNAMVFCFTAAPPVPQVRWLRVYRPNGTDLSAAILGEARPNTVETTVRELDEALSTGFSRPPRPSSTADGDEGVPLARLARVVRGIATGENDFFFFTDARRRAAGLDTRWFRRAVGRTRDCPGDALELADLDRLDAAGRPTWLLYLGAEDLASLPAALRAHLREGERRGLPERALLRTRRPWYRSERREPPGILFAYLGRRTCRFILNRAGVLPLTGFLCVYPHDPAPETAQRLWRALNHPATLANLPYVAKSYGGGALKVEPRGLDALQIPPIALRAAGWDEAALRPAVTAPQQLRLLEEPGT